MKKLFDKNYSITARVFPAIISALPLLMFTVAVSNNELKALFKDVLSLKIISDISVSIILIYLATQICRILGKELFEKRIFKDEMEMPTTNFLLFSKANKVSNERKNTVRTIISEKFGISIPKELEEQDIEEAKKRIVEAVGLMRDATRDSTLLLQHNKEYGFARNLVGGSIIGLLFSILDTFYFYKIQKNDTYLTISLILLTFYFILLVLSKTIIVRYGKLYASRLIEEFIFINSH